MAGYFITIEGPDGAGKSTQISLMVSYLKEKGYDVIVTREPGGSPIGERIREIILDVNCKEMDPVTEMLLYAASRAQHVAQVILPALDQGKVVICDRFVDSSVAYQGYGRGLGAELVREVNQTAVKGLVPHLTLLFLIDPAKALNRKGKKEAMDRLEQEKEEFHQRVYDGYREMAEQDAIRIHPIDASKPIEVVHGQVTAVINDLLKSGK